MALTKLDFEPLRNAIALMSPVKEKDEHMGNPVTKGQFLYFLEKLQEILMKIEKIK